MSKAAEPKVQEYLYTYSDDSDGDWVYWWRTDPEQCKAQGMNPYTYKKSIAHRITKKTDKFIFVERDIFGWYDWQSGEVKQYDKSRLHEESYRIDRAKLETKGYAFVKHESFYALPYEKTEQYQDDVNLYHRRRNGIESPTPSFLQALGLALPCTIEDVKQAWRKLAKEYHPDTGGNAARFIELQASYTNALAFFGKG